MEERKISNFIFFSKAISLFFFLLMLAIAIGEGFNPFIMEMSELILAVPILVIWIGLLIGGIKWELMGGLMVMAGIFTFLVVRFPTLNYMAREWFLFLLILPGISLIIASRYKKRKKTYFG